MADVGYTLKCAYDGVMNSVVSHGPLIIMWACSTCGTINISSLPATADGKQATTPIQSITIIPQNLLSTIINLIQGQGV